jgi:N-acetylmuramic acid 6-phosphate etherase
MVDRSPWRHLTTEASNPRLTRLDTLSTEEIVETMIRDSRHVVAAVQRAKGRIAKASKIVASALLGGGRLIFVGAGTSGRLGVLEAAELPPTFGIEPSVARAVMAGGHAAVVRAKEGVEDDSAEGERVLHDLQPLRKDVVIGISASGITPFVRGALSHARRKGTPVIVITTSRRKSAIAKLADVLIVLSVGPELIAGSTRLKAGTATKVALNILTTTAMIRVGKTYRNLMVDVAPNSDKLRDRARRIIATVTGLAYNEADALLRRAGWNVKAAILMQQGGITRVAALSRLRSEPRLRKLLRGR